MKHDDFKLEPTKDGEARMRRWLQAREAKELADSRANQADCELRNAETALAEWMLPEDAKAGEKVLMWCIDSLLQAELFQNGDKRVTVRSHGRKGLP